MKLVARFWTAIRQFPEQYLWYYQRFNIIPPNCPDELKKRYPYYAKPANARFYSRAKRTSISL